MLLDQHCASIHSFSMEDKRLKSETCMNKRKIEIFSCVCASAECDSHDCQSASHLLYHQLLDEILDRALVINKKISEKSSKLQKDLDLWNCKVKVLSTEATSGSYPLEKLKADMYRFERSFSIDWKKLEDLGTYMGHIIAKLGTVEDAVSFKTVLELDEQLRKKEEQLNIVK